MIEQREEFFRVKQLNDRNQKIIERFEHENDFAAKLQNEMSTPEFLRLLRGMDSNHDKQIQSLLYYRYTTPQVSLLYYLSSLIPRRLSVDKEQ